MGYTILHRWNRWWRSSYRQAGKKTPKTHCSAGGRKPHLKKSHCHIHATLKQKLDAVHKLRFQHAIRTLCRVLSLNRSSYYKHFSTQPAPRIQENQPIASLILHIHSVCNKHLGAYKITYILKRDYGINISVGRVYRLMKQLQLPKISSDKPHVSARPPQNTNCCHHLQQNFS